MRVVCQAGQCDSASFESDAGVTEAVGNLPFGFPLPSVTNDLGDPKQCFGVLRNQVHGTFAFVVACEQIEQIIDNSARPSRQWRCFQRIINRDVGMSPVFVFRFSFTICAYVVIGSSPRAELRRLLGEYPKCH